jgi:hypothetical protein
MRPFARWKGMATTQAQSHREELRGATQVGIGMDKLVAHLFLIRLLLGLRRLISFALK